MRQIQGKRRWGMSLGIMLVLSSTAMIIPTALVKADDPFATSLALALLADPSVLVSATYSDADYSGNRQATVLSSLGMMSPTNGDSFVIMSSGIAGDNPVTTNHLNPGNEEGTWFAGGRGGYPRDKATLTMTLQVPEFMHYLYYDVQFFSSEYPEWIGSAYNDELKITVASPSQGTSQYKFDINSGYFVFDSEQITGSGFDIFADGDPGGVDEHVSTTPNSYGADAGASDLIPIGGNTHPVSPNEQITVTISITDAGDNICDSAAFIDNLMFTGYAKTEIIARKNVQDLNGGDAECGDILEYSVTVSNTGTADQHDNPGNEFEDVLPENVSYVAGSASATKGTISYESGERKICWNGGVNAESSVSLIFEVSINEGLPNNAEIGNQGIVYWDSNEDGSNDATELTDNPHINDGIDQDGDGDTDDDDPTIVYVVSFEPPLSVTEDFSDDVSGTKATQSYLDRRWFETSEGTLGSIFEVATGYRYATANAFKTKLRASGGEQYWNYTLSALESDIRWWEVWFACGNGSEESEITLEFLNTDGEEIAKLRFSHVQAGANPPTDWIVSLSFWNPSSGWSRLYTDYPGGYLFNDWYKLRLESYAGVYVNYTLYRDGKGLVDLKTAESISAPFSNLASVRFTSSLVPVVCPMIFWDDHTIGLVQ
jgi:uncharacterized repeat protein (TIGR01451 family)